MSIHLLIIDPQNDFCDPGGALFVPGSPDDINNLVSLLSRNITTIDEIHLTLDSHHWTHIAHPIFWTNDAGESPDPFAIITPEDLSTWHSRDPRFLEYAAGYVKKLRENGRFQLCIWPPHCIIGTPGHNIANALGKSLRVFEETFRPIHYYNKGSNCLTEHYSALRAEVPDLADARTCVNQDLLDRLAAADRILVAGQALSHCVANTVTDLIHHLGNESAGKFTLLRDTTSNVAGFENLGDDFLRQIEAQGAHIVTTSEFSA